MIKTRQDYLNYLAADRNACTGNPKRNKLIMFFKRLSYSEQAYIDQYIHTLRTLEYYTNKKRFFFDAVFFWFYTLKMRRLTYKTKIYIPVNVVGKGLSIKHIGFIRIAGKSKVGERCTLQPGVIIGQKSNEDNVPIIGDNVYFAPGAKIFGKLHVGNNVIIAPNSVVVKNVPDNCVVSGVPAQIIKQNI